MTLYSPKGDSTMVAYPRTLLLMCGIPFFLILASLLLVSQPVGYTVRGYFYDVGNSWELGSMVRSNKTIHDSYNYGNEGLSKLDEDRRIDDSSVKSDLFTSGDSQSKTVDGIKDDLSDSQQEEEIVSLPTGNYSSSNAKTTSLGLPNSSDIILPGLAPTSLSLGPGDVSQSGSEVFFQRMLVYKTTHLGDSGLLSVVRGTSLSAARRSEERTRRLDVEVPKNVGNKRVKRYYFRSTSTTIVRIWSSWLVHATSEPFDVILEGVVKLHLDVPDEGIMEFIQNLDVIALSSGHWFAKQSVYILNNEIVGGQLWWPDQSRPMKVNNVEAFGISVETILGSIVTHPNYTGLTIVRSFSPDHYNGGAWNTGGSCMGKVKPALDSELVENGFTNIMHQKQVEGFNRTVKKMTNRSKLKLMDITKAFRYRQDGHPGPYRSPDPNKITKPGPDGKPPHRIAYTGACQAQLIHGMS
ncbi:similar to TRICHOME BIREFRINGENCE-LIKE 18 [Actinidia rufa]|uniref:Similar to TRICHOME BIREFRINGENCE-LIKE 18 n=1 Tax=Actinidia rufa TaxID=165716 RepID=A0A7J0E6B1_9ERIC|nr:similar to TRICHOME BIREFRINGENCE-LIKE 18 [Actinidia rufa]